MKEILAKLIFDAISAQTYCKLAPDLKSVEIDGECDLTALAEYLQQRGVEVIG